MFSVRMPCTLGEKRLDIVVMVVTGTATEKETATTTTTVEEVERPLPLLLLTGHEEPLERELLQILAEAAEPLSNQQIIRLVHQRKVVKGVGKSHINRELHRLRVGKVLRYEEDGKGNKLWETDK